MRVLMVALVVVLALGAFGSTTEAQDSLPVSLFERYIESLRRQTGIPGLSAAIVQDGRVAWEKGFGYQDVGGLVAATPDTPYPIGDLSQTLSATLLLHRCVERSHMDISDDVRRWDPSVGAGGTTIGQLLSHTSPSGDFNYDPARFAGLTAVVEQCAGGAYPQLVADQLLDFLGMSQSVPGADLGDPSSANRGWFSSGALDRYAAVLGRQALPYRIDSRGRPTRGDAALDALDASTGIVSTVRDLARFDAALDDGTLLDAATRSGAWTRVASGQMGLGWFVQDARGERIVWHFGLTRDAYSSLVIKVPARRLTLILLANSDGLVGPPYNLSNGSLTSNLFASVFLSLFVG
ncbi:MAG: serine hydrolase [Acidobacteria bacterium]|nr:serine hydrolase [Acidobacteriota bacterium]